MIHKQALFYVIPAFTPLFSPALNPSSIYSITWQESWYFPWDSMSYSPLTKFTSNHAPPYHCPPLPGYCSQRFSSLQIKELCCLSPFFFLALPGVCFFQGQLLPLIHKDLRRISDYVNSHLQYFILCLKLIMIDMSPVQRRKESWMDEWMDGWSEWRHGWIDSVGVAHYMVPGCSQAIQTNVWLFSKRLYAPMSSWLSNCFQPKGYIQ